MGFLSLMGPLLVSIKWDYLKRYGIQIMSTLKTKQSPPTDCIFYDLFSLFHTRFFKKIWFNPHQSINLPVDQINQICLARERLDFLNLRI